MARQKRKYSGMAEKLIEEYDIQSAGDIQNVLKDLLGETLEKILEAELDGHLGYEKNDDAEGTTDNRRNGTTSKKS